MTIDSYLNIARQQTGENRNEELRKEKAATDFEEIFARHLVEEMTKGSFQMTDNQGGPGQSNRMYREFIVDTLSGELAAQRKLGMADLVTKYWDQVSGRSD